MTRDQILRAQVYQVVSIGIGMLRRALKTLPVAIIVTAIVYALVCIVENKNRKEIKHKKAILLLSMYTMIMLQLVIIARPIGTNYHPIDWIPFDTQGGWYLVALYAFANAIVFLPVGILVPTIWKRFRDYKSILVIGVASSMVIEITQYILHCGVCQTEDLIMNTLGAVVGYWIYRKR